MESMNYSQTIADGLKIHPHQVGAAIELIDAGNTIPFIARYRKEATGGLSDDQLFQIQQQLAKLRSVDQRRQAILKSISEQGKLTDELQQKIQAAESLTSLEDLYQPFKPKRKTRASVARELGLQPLADMILAQSLSTESLEKLAQQYLSETLTDIGEVWQGARDIVAETFSEHPEVRRLTRESAMKWGVIRTEKIADAEDPRKTYELYYDGEFRVDRLRPHQVLAIHRGEAEKILRVSLDTPEQSWKQAAAQVFRMDRRSPLAGQLSEAIQDGASRLLLPAIERDVERILTDAAEHAAIQVFMDNLRSLLNQPPVEGKVVLGIDPGYRTGCKLAVVDGTGKVLATGTIYPHEPQKKWKDSLDALSKLVSKYEVNLISIGNGTASRETEKLASELIKMVGITEPSRQLHYVIVNEAGASVYSASSLARSELPDLDVSLRGAVSIARRIQDPLAELVKIDPKSIGVGMYQHDVDQSSLSDALRAIVESVVNRVGVDANTASAALLQYVAGIGPKLAERIVAYRDTNGPFQERKELREVPGLGPKAFEQAAGFLRITNGSQPFDATAIHPESYALAEKMLASVGLTADSPQRQRQQISETLHDPELLRVLAEELHAGLPTIKDIFEQLIRPGRDPRKNLPAPILRQDVMSLDDLSAGMRLRGTVRNVVEFGAFVDIGVKQDGLLHKSQMPAGLSLHVGDVIEVLIKSIEAERGRISLGWAQS
jgi:uncharacterized protein